MLLFTKKLYDFFNRSHPMLPRFGLSLPFDVYVLICVSP